MGFVQVENGRISMRCFPCVHFRSKMFGGEVFTAVKIAVFTPVSGFLRFCYPLLLRSE